VGKLETCKKFADLDYIRPKAPVSILAPPLTTREKLALDRLLPSAAPLAMQQVSALGFDLTKDQVATYCRFFAHYPLFSEIQN
jgi:hypothetical protein